MRKPLADWLTTAVLALCIASSAAYADDSYPQWRGSHRDGVVSTPAPETWPDSLRQVWKVEIGEGHATPIVADGRVYVHARRDDREVAAALSLETGATLWTQSNDAPYEMNGAARGHGKGPKSTPVYAQGRLYTFGISGILSCFNGETGELVWRHDLSEDFDNALPLYGTSMSPMVVDGMLIAHMGGHDKGSLMAFDAFTGAVKWAWPGDGPAYTSPIVATFDGVRQIVTQSQSACLGLDVETGKLLWRFEYVTVYDQNVVTPVVLDDTVIFSGIQKGTAAYRPVRTGDGWQAEVVWANEDVSMYMSSPILSDGLLIGFGHKKKGRFFCLDATTGELLWKSEGRQGEQAALIGVGDVVLSQMSDGELLVIRKSAEAFDLAARYTVADSPTWATTVPLEGHLLVKDFAHLTLWGLK